MQETQVWSLIQEDPTCRQASHPVASYNDGACALEPGDRTHSAHTLQLLKSLHPRAHVLQVQPCREKPTHCKDVQPLRARAAESPRSNKDNTYTANTNTYISNYLKIKIHIAIQNAMHLF